MAEVYGRDLRELFVNAAQAMFETIVDLGSVRAQEEVTIEAHAEDQESLLVSWLSELLFIFETRRLLLAEFHVERIDQVHVKGRARGERFDPSRHTFYTEIKAVTYHQLRVEKANDHWLARVLFDI